MRERLAFGLFCAAALLVGGGLVYFDRRDQVRQKETYARAFDENSAVWSKANIANYEFSLVFRGAWPEAPPMRISVRHGVIQSATLLCLPPRTADDCRKWAEAWKDIYGPDKLPTYARTIPQLFDRMSNFSAQASAISTRISADFDPNFGFPTWFSFDDPEVADDEYAFVVSDFAVSQ